MTRTEKKCIIGSAALHGLLLLVLVLGSAFVNSKTVTLPPVVTMVAVPTDRPVSSGGNPNGNPDPPAPAPQPVQPPPLQPQPQSEPPKPKPEPVKQPEPQPEPPKPKPVVKTPPKPVVKEKGDLPVKAAPKPVAQKEVKEPVKETKPVVSAPPKRVISTNVVRRSNAEQIAAQNAARELARRREAEERAYKQALADYKRQQAALANQVGGIVGGVGKSLSQSTVVEPLGPGGAAFVNYASLVREIYDRAWRVSPDLTDNDSSALARITIRRDGTVESASISRRSGNTLLDKSVRNALDSVRFVAPFPEGSRDEQRTFTIEFNLRTRKAVG